MPRRNRNAGGLARARSTRSKPFWKRPADDRAPIVHAWRFAPLTPWVAHAFKRPRRA